MNAYKFTADYHKEGYLLPQTGTVYVEASNQWFAAKSASAKFHDTFKTRRYFEAKLERIPRWVDQYVIQEWWGRWEDVCTETTREGLRVNLRAYRENSRVAVRFVTRKVINPLLRSE